MSPRFALTHESRYRYARPARLGPQLIRLYPAQHGRCTVTHYRLDITPKPERLDWFFDPAGNRTARALFYGVTDEFTVTVALEADVSPILIFCLIWARKLGLSRWNPGLPASLRLIWKSPRRGRCSRR
jgi:transglutaminase-like putative cysteine protease